MENLTKQQKIIILIIAIIVAIGIIYFILNKNQLKTNINLEDEILIGNMSSTNEIHSEDELIVVHITGSVKSPGIVRLKEGSRIEDSIEAAGGLTENADISKVNLAYILDDGIKIRIPSSTDENIENEDILSENSGENIIEEENTIYSKESRTININKATEAELQTLPGIGESLAIKIIEYRNQNGKFSNIEEIKNVNGIGENKYVEIKDLITVK